MRHPMNYDTRTWHLVAVRTGTWSVVASCSCGWRRRKWGTTGLWTSGAYDAAERAGQRHEHENAGTEETG